MDKPIAGASTARRTCAAARCAAIDATRGCPRGREPHPRHDREPARLGGLAPARLGRADHRVRREPATAAAEILKDERVNAHRRPSRRRAPTPGSRSDGALPPRRSATTRLITRRSTTSSTSGSTRLDPRLHARGARPTSTRKRAAADTVMYLEGSDQHRGWFHSSLLESCGTRGRAPYDVVLTHGFVLDEKGAEDVEVARQRGRAAGRDQAVGRRHPAPWVCASDYADDLRIGPEILKTFVETYRKLRNTLRWMLGSLAHFRDGGARSPERDAGARALHAASARRARRRESARPTTPSTTSGSSRSSTRS